AARTFSGAANAAAHRAVRMMAFMAADDSFHASRVKSGRTDALSEWDEIAKELLGTPFPGVALGELAACGAIRLRQAMIDGAAEIFIQTGDVRAFRKEVARRVRGIRSDGRPAGDGFEHHQANRVGTAREDHDIGGCVRSGQGRAVQRAGELHIRMRLPEAVEKGAIANGHLVYRPVDVQECLDILFAGNATDVDGERPGTLGAFGKRLELLSIDAA